ncbi:MAG: 2'-5' RNA ligase family protein, partial [Planctomycetota bacterium]
AVDIVVLPSDEMSGYAIEVNKELLKTFDNEIILNYEDCLPHISLAMGCIDEKDTPDIEEILQDIAKRYSFSGLRVVDVRAETVPAGKKVSCFQIEKTKELQLLHEEVMERLAPYLTYDVTTAMLFSPPQVEEATLFWIKNYPEKSSFENFSPHITIGFGETDKVEVPIKFAALKLALCHLGNHCTCRKVLVSNELGS